MTMLDLKAHLNPAQLEAVTHTGSPLLVLAGPGSGKTRVLTYKVAYLVGEKGIPPYRLMAVTFTNKAAREMGDRVSALLGGVDRGMWLGTFHSLCARILRRSGGAMGIDPGFVIYDERDSRSLMKRVLKTILGGAEIEETSPLPPPFLLSILDRARNRMERVEDRVKREFHRNQGKIDLALTALREYEKGKKRAGALDFSDLLHLTARLLRESPETRRVYREKFHYILVDEYQDTNPVQFELLRLIHRDDAGICVVGDDDQSIYRFRGAEIRNILEFERHFRDVRTIKLERNYRSTGHILHLARDMVERNRGRKGKNLYTELGEGEKVNIAVARDEWEEARFITKGVMQLVREGEEPGDIAIFIRTNAQSRVLEEEFMSAGIPYELLGARRFYERKEIKDIVAYLRLLLNRADDESLLRVINTPPRNIGAATLNIGLEIVREEGVHLFDALNLGLERGLFRGRRRAAMEDFFRLMERMGERLSGLTPQEMIEMIGDDTGYIEYLKGILGGEGISRIENINEMVASAGVGDYGKGEEALREYLERVSLHGEGDEVREREGKVLILTLHLAKGLEFGTVFIPGVEEGIIPHWRAVESEGVAGIEEERRLLYVGITRAKRRLYISFSEIPRSFRWGGGGRGGISPFLHDIPEEHIQRRSGMKGMLKDMIEEAKGGKMYSPDPPAPSTAGTTPLFPEFSPGKRVFHPRLGRGFIRGRDLINGGVKLTVRFTNGTTVKLLLPHSADLLTVIE